MTRSKLGKCISVIIISAFLLCHLAVYPVARARAAAVLPAVGAAVTVAAFLNACGIFPYNVGDSTFTEWGAENLAELWEQYVVDTGVQTTAFNAIKAFIVGNVIAYPKVTWESLREFAQWIVQKFSVTDNQQQINLGQVVPVAFPSLPATNSVGNDGVVLNGFLVGNLYVSGDTWKVGKYLTISDDVVVGAVGTNNDCKIYLLSLASFGFWSATNDARVSSSTSNGQMSAFGDTIYLFSGDSLRFSSISSTIPIFSSADDMYRAFLGLSSSGSSFSGITADTSTVSVPGELNPDSVFAGLRVSGLPAQATTDAVEDAIEQGVQVRAQPVVELTEVELGEGTEVDTETGAITQNPGAVIEGEVAETIPGVSALTAPQEFLSALQTAVTTKFPFCLPFDVARVLSAFVKAPVAPVIALTFHDPFTDADYTVSVDLSPWDDVAAIVRQLESMLLFVGFWLNFDKFNVLNIILGQIG